MSQLLRMDGVTKCFKHARRMEVVAARTVSLSVRSGESFALIGESGSGKSTIGRLALRLLRPDEGAVLFEGIDLANIGGKDLKAFHSKVAAVFQEPFESLDPLMTVRQIVEEPLRIHESRLLKGTRNARVWEALELVALGKRYLDARPAELSGGQQQRVGVARAIITRPRFVVLDEPTSSLDLSVRSTILTLLRSLQRNLGLTYLFISHDIDTVQYVADRVGVMYMGQILEVGPTQAVLEHPQHPYTEALLSSHLSIDPRIRPNTLMMRDDDDGQAGKAGCIFFQRCPHRLDARCVGSTPPLRSVGQDHYVATFCDIPAGPPSNKNSDPPGLAKIAVEHRKF